MDPTTPTPVHTNRKKVAPRTKIALWLMIGPTMLIAVAFILFGITNVVLGNIPESLPTSCIDQSPSANGALVATEACEKELFGEFSFAESLLNIFLFTVGAVGVFTWIPGLITGIVLLIKRPKDTPTAN